MADDTAPLHADIAALLSAPRIAAYLAASPHGTTASALDLYRWNLRISAAFYESLHYLEVALRNTADTSFVTWHTSHHTDLDPWYRCPGIPLTLKPGTRSVRPSDSRL